LTLWRTFIPSFRFQLTPMTLNPFQILLKLPQKYFQFLDKSSMPNTNYIKDKREQKIIHTRTKSLLAMESVVALLFGFNILIGNGEFLNNILGMFACSICVALGILFIKVHPEVFNTFVNVLNISFGIASSYYNAEGPQAAWLVASTFPFVIYIATGSLLHFTINILAQFYLVNFFFQKIMREHLTYVDPDIFLRNLTFQTNQTILYIAFMTIFSHLLMKQALDEAINEEKKRIFFEKQKNFLMSFSHELRNLLNSLMGNVRLASLEKVNEKVKELLLNAEFSAEMLLQLINNILDTGKVEVGDLEINPSPVKIYDLVERVWSICSEIIKTKGFKGRVMVSKNIPQVLTLDHYRLTQILFNLVGNAAKYTDRGEIDISVEWLANTTQITNKCFEPYPFNEENEQDEGLFEKKRTLSIFDPSILSLTFNRKKIDRNLLAKSPDSCKGILKVTVRDTGIGMPKEQMHLLFKRFSQITSDLSKRKLGTGLGLFITKELCERMKGKIRAFSQLGKGSAFTFCLPVEPVYEEQSSLLLDKQLVKKLALNKGLKAMIVDDEPVNHAILKEFFEMLGVKVVEIAENGHVALQKYTTSLTEKNDPINIVTMDISMPLMDGKASAQKMREFEVLKGLSPALMMVISGDCSESEMNYCTKIDGNIRADVFLKKPANVEEIARVLAIYLSKIYEPEEIQRVIAQQSGGK